MTEDTSNNADGLEEEKICDILLWAIFANRKELAEICWLRSKNHLCKFFFHKRFKKCFKYLGIYR